MTSTTHTFRCNCDKGTATDRDGSITCDNPSCFFYEGSDRVVDAADLTSAPTGCLPIEYLNDDAQINNALGFIDDEPQPVGTLTDGEIERMAELARLPADGARLVVYRDWEGVVRAVAVGNVRPEIEALFIHEDGRIAWGNVRNPRYVATHAELIATAGLDS